MAGLERADDVVLGRPVRSWSAGVPHRQPEVVFVPGLGAPGYLMPWATAVSAWTRASVVDLPGWRWGRARACPPTVDGVADAIVDWLRVRATGPVVLVGHSTGSQAVTRAALARPDLLAGVVLVGPTFDPEVRRPAPLLRAGVRTIVREHPAELPAVLPSYLHSGGRPLLHFLLDALPDRPESVVADLRPPVLIMTGRHDGFAPPAWAAELARVAGAPHVVFPGAHNFCFHHAAASDAVLRIQVDTWTAARAQGNDPLPA